MKHETPKGWGERARAVVRSVVRTNIRPLGHKTWVVPGGRIPPESTGPEPRCTSHDELCFLNTSDGDAAIQVTVYFDDADPLGPFRFPVPAQRTRHVRVNDLMDPEPIPYDTPYAVVVESDVPVVVQFNRLDSARAEHSRAATMAFPAD